MLDDDETLLFDGDVTKDKIEAQFDKLSAEVDKLKARVEGISADQRTKFYDYVETLDEKRESLKDRVDALEDASSEAYDDIETGLKDAWQRVAIAKKAAEARFDSDAVR